MFCRAAFASVRGANRDVFRLSCAKRLSPRCFGNRFLSTVPGLHVSEEVRSALASGKPVVALETAILTHGLPAPHNLDCAFAVEARIRAEGVLPATVGMLDGKLIVGLSAAELTRLAEASERKEAQKISRRDVAAALVRGNAGGTTVSGTMLAAEKAGISVFVTGGIGGVHRGGEMTMDVSADLTELGRTPVAVVCAGCKSILDIGRTLEYLETQGVPTVVLGNGRSFPAFFVADSGFTGSHSARTPSEVARMIHHSMSLGLDSGLVVGVPIPREAAADGQEVEYAIQQALLEVEEFSVTGSGVTPFILSRVNELTEGKSLAANLALIKNNAKVGAHIAKELCNLRTLVNTAGSNQSRHANSNTSTFSPASAEGYFSNLSRDHQQHGLDLAHESGQQTATRSVSAEELQQELDDEFLRLAGESAAHCDSSRNRESDIGSGFSDSQIRHMHTAASSSQPMSSDTDMADRQPIATVGEVKSDLVVVGAAISDLVARARDGNVQLNMTNASTLSRAFGGVGRNVAEATIRFGTQPLFLSAVGDDFIHHDLLRHWTKTLGADSCGIRIVAGEQTSVYVAVLHESGELHTGLGSFDVLKYVSPDWLDKFRSQLMAAKLVCFDGNLSSDTIAHICETCGTAGVPVWFEPTDTAKAKKPFSSASWQHISIATPNIFELQSMAKAAVECECYDVTKDQVAALSAQTDGLVVNDKLQLCRSLAPLLLRHMPMLLVTLGFHGTLLLTSGGLDVEQPWLHQLRSQSSSSRDCCAVWYDVVPGKKTQGIVSVSGAGDSLAGAALAGIAQGLSVSECITSGLWAAQQSLSTVLPINPAISHEAFRSNCGTSMADFATVVSGWNNILGAAVRASRN